MFVYQRVQAGELVDLKSRFAEQLWFTLEVALALHAAIVLAGLAQSWLVHRRFMACGGFQSIPKSWISWTIPNFGG